jgi:secreted Zn-dependent insulinase-like peptidase
MGWFCVGLQLEHMLFMGSEKYPSENEYDAFITGHGGYR